MVWRLANLASLAAFGPQYGANSPAIPATGERPRYVRISDIDTSGRLIPTSIVEADLEEYSDFLLKEGDLLFARSGNTVGKTYRHDSKDGPCIFAGYLIRFRIDPNLSDSSFIFYYTLSSGYHAWVMSKRRVAGQPNINGKEYLVLQVPFFPLSEQRRIVEILDQADALRRQRAEANANATRILPAFFIKMFGDPATNPLGWPTKPLGEVTIGNPQYGANASAAGWTDGSPRYVRITDITSDGRLLKTGVVSLDLDDWAPYKLTQGDLLFARSGNTVGKTYLYQPQDGLCAYAGYLIRFKADKNQVLPWYLFALTQTGYYRRWVETRKRVGGQPNINGKEYSSLQIPCPPIPLQEVFVEMMEWLIDVRQKSNIADEKMQYLFSVLLHRAFTGDLTVNWREAHMKELLAEMEQQTKINQGSL